MGYFRDANPCQWGRVAVVMRAGDTCNISGWGGLMLWQRQPGHTNLERRLNVTWLGVKTTCSWYGLKIIVRCSRDADSLPVKLERRIVVLLVGGVGKGCGRPKCLKNCMGRRLNLTWLKFRILRLIMNRKNLLQLNIQTSSCLYEWQSMLRGDKIIFACNMYCVYLHAILSWKKKTNKNVYKNLT